MTETGEVSGMRWARSRPDCWVRTEVMWEEIRRCAVSPHDCDDQKLAPGYNRRSSLLSGSSSSAEEVMIPAGGSSSVEAVTPSAGDRSTGGSVTVPPGV